MIPQDMDLWSHLDAMTDERGLFEHAKYSSPRLEHGYCTDDNARLLIVTSRDHDSDRVERLRNVAFAFCAESMTPDGRVHNRMDGNGRWTDNPRTDDSWGRCLWSLGVVTANCQDPYQIDTARHLFTVGAQQRSPWKRSMAFAALGAAAMVTSDPTNSSARALLKSAVEAIGEPLDTEWLWPEPRLTYANAVLAEAVIAAGVVLDDPRILKRGLMMLEWLLDTESRNGWLSVTSTQGRSSAEVGPRFDQQPIEVASMADACWRAYSLTFVQRWASGVLLAEAWFEGMNDSRTIMFDPITGGGYDGLHAHGANQNQGAESTLALVSTKQRSRALEMVSR